MTATVEITNRGQITIPIEMRKALGLKNGTKFMIAQNQKLLMLLPIPSSKKSDIMNLYGVFKPKRKVMDPDKAIELAKLVKARETIKQLGEKIH